MIRVCETSRQRVEPAMSTETQASEQKRPCRCCGIVSVLRHGDLMGQVTCIKMHHMDFFVLSRLPHAPPTTTALQTQFHGFHFSAVLLFLSPSTPPLTSCQVWIEISCMFPCLACGWRFALSQLEEQGHLNNLIGATGPVSLLTQMGGKWWIDVLDVEIRI